MPRFRYGPETLDPERVNFIPGVSSFDEYGGHFSLELTEVKSKAGAVSFCVEKSRRVRFLRPGVSSVRGVRWELIEEYGRTPR